MSEAVQELWKLAHTTIRQIRSTYIDNPHLGLASWFDEFDHLLLQQELPKCLALLKEIREEGYQLDVDERVYVASREAALLLNQGIGCYQQQDYENARQYYEASRRIYHLLDEADGEGQANLALDVLQNQQPGKEIDTQLLKSLAANPKVIGNSSTLLTERVRHLEVPDRLQAILAAKKRGYPLPLLAGLSSTEKATQSAAATALAWLQPGPDHSTLVDAMITSTNWIVRWQAASILRWRVEKQSQELAPQRDGLRQAVVQRLNDGEHDPAVRREMVLLLRQIGAAGEIPVLVKLLRDPDPDVRFAVIEVLDDLGDRRALSALHYVQDGQDFKENKIGIRAREAIQTIEQRHPYPLPEVQKIVCCSEVTAEKEPVQPTLQFLANELTIYCVVTILHPKPGTRVTSYLLERGRPLLQEVQVIPHSTDEQSEEPLIELSSSSRPGNRQPMFESSEQKPAYIGLSTVLIFALAPVNKQWASGNYVLQIAIDDVVQRELPLRVMSPESLAAAEQAIRLDPASALAYYDKGYALYELGRYEEALASCEQAIRLDSHYAPAYVYKGYALYELGRYEEALASCEQAIRLDSHYAPAYGSKGLAFCGLTRYEEALDACETAIKLDPSYSIAYSNKGIALEALQRYEEALAAYDQAIFLDPNCALYYGNKGKVLRILQRYEEALAAYDQAISREPASAVYYNNKAFALNAFRRYEEAMNAYEEAIRLDPSSAIYKNNKGNTLFSLQHYEEALEAYEEACNLEATSAIFYTNKGIALYGLQHYEEALKTLEQAIQLDPTSAYAFYYRGRCLHDLGHFEEALSAYDQAIHNDPYYTSAYNSKGLTLYALEREEEALVLYDQAMELDSENAPGQENRGDVFARLRGLEGASPGDALASVNIRASREQTTNISQDELVRGINEALHVPPTIDGQEDRPADSASQRETSIDGDILQQLRDLFD